MRTRILVTGCLAAVIVTAAFGLAWHAWFGRHVWEPSTPDAMVRDRLIATVNTVDGTPGDVCVSAVDPTVHEEWGQLCGEIFARPGVDLSVGDRVVVQWLSLAETDEEGPREVLLVEPSRRSK